MKNYGREMKMGVDFRRKGKIEIATEFVERIRKVQKEVRAALMKVQKEMKRQVDRERKEVKEWKVRDRMILCTKDLTFKERPTRKLVD